MVKAMIGDRGCLEIGSRSDVFWDLGFGSIGLVGDSN